MQGGQQMVLRGGGTGISFPATDSKDGNHCAARGLMKRLTTSCGSLSFTSTTSTTNFQVADSPPHTEFVIFICFKVQRLCSFNLLIEATANTITLDLAEVRDVPIYTDILIGCNHAEKHRTLWRFFNNFSYTELLDEDRSIDFAPRITMWAWTIALLGGEDLFMAMRLKPSLPVPLCLEAFPRPIPLFFCPYCDSQRRPYRIHSQEWWSKPGCCCCKHSGPETPSGANSSLGQELFATSEK